MNLTQLLLSYTVLISFVNSQVVGVIKNKADDKPIEGVNILVGQKGTTSDKDGVFKIEYNVDQDIEFSHIGFKKLSLGKDIFLKNTGIYLIPSIIKTEEIFVTSGLNKKNLYKSAKSVTIFTKDRIRENPDIHLQTYLEEVPNLNWAGGSSRPRYFQIRGVGESSHYFGEGPPNFSVGFSVDDMDLSGLGMLGHLFDIGQVEIFKGPQSTTFGSNALAGLIAIKSNDPSRNLGLETSLSFGSDNLRSVGSMLNINLTNNLFLRLSSSVNYSDGFRKNKSLDMSNSNKKEESFARLKVKFLPSPNISFLGTFLYADLSNGYDVWAPDNNMNFNTYSDSLGEDSQLTKGLSIRSEFSLTDNVTITAISSITETDLIHAYDGDWGDSLYWGENHNWDEITQGWAYSFFDKNKKNRKNLNNEIRFKYSNLTLGLFSKNLEEYDTALGYLYGGSATNANSNFSHDVYAIYGQLEHKITERLSITSNFRRENSKYAYLGQSVGIDSYYEAINLPNISFKTDEKMNGYKFSGKYEMNNKTNFFATFSKGFKAGGVNQQPFLALINRPFGPEFLYNYEIGLKNKTSKTDTRFTAFLGLRKNQQVSISSQQEDGNPNSFLFYIDNATSGENNGFEFENTFKIFKKLNLSTSIGYLNTHIAEFTYQISENDSISKGGGREAAMSPNTASLGLSFKPRIDILINFNVSYKGEYYFSDSFNEKSAEYSILNFSIGKKFNNFKLTFWGNNILNEKYATRGFYFGLIPPDYPEQLFKSYGDPRQLGIKIDYLFKK